MQVYLGIDWGATYIKAGLVDSQANIIKKKVYISQDLKKKEIFIQNLENLLNNFRSFRIRGVGIGAPGIIDIKKGFIYYLPNIAGWRNYPLGNILKKRFKLPIAIDNDANVFGLAEARYGAAQGKSRAIFLTLGTGLGGAILIDGKLLRGKTSAVELGHVPINIKGRLCGCGARGCIETYVGANYLLERYRQLTRIQEGAIEVKEVFKRGLNGEKAAICVWKEFSYNLGRFLAGMINVFNPEVIVCGGGVSGAFCLFKPLLKQVIQDKAMWPQVKNLKILKAKLKQPGIIGAALLAKEEEK